MRLYSTLFLLFSTILLSCSGSRHTQAKNNDGKLELVFLQVNDVYEIAPLSNGASGGLARIATLRKQYLAKNPNTFLVLCGDFLSPSVYNTIRYQGKEILGKQMVESMNAAGFNFVTFGNHEFDLGETELQQRINESAFEWISSNAFHLKNGNSQPFAKDSPTIQQFAITKILSVTDADGTTAKIGLIGLVLPFNKKKYVMYEDPLNKAKQLYNQIKDSCDVVIALTHQLVEDDEKMAREIPQLAAILGGHEHDMRFEKIGNVFISKAHANARTAFVTKVQINKNDHHVNVLPELVELDSKIGIDSSTNVVVQKWIRIADSNYATLGFDPRTIVMQKGDSLDGREAVIRTRSTNLMKLITEAMASACPQSDLVALNSGSVRVDDILYPPISQYDILRTLPFGKGMWEVDMNGVMVNRLLETGRINKGTGGYLQVFPAVYDSLARKWQLKNQDIVPDKIYRVALSDFLLTGQETRLDFLNRDSATILKVYPQQSAEQSDIRLAVINFLKRK